LAANPHTGKARTATQLDALAQKLAQAGNYFQSCQTVCSDSTPSLGSDTLAKLQAKNPQGTVDFDKLFWPSAADMDGLRQDDAWLHVEKGHFSVDNIRKYFACFPPLSAQDTDGWRLREHVAFLFSEDDADFHNLIRKHMVLPFITGDFFPGHLEGVAGGKYFALVKPNAGDAPIPNAGGVPVDVDVRCIVIGSTGRGCGASRAVDESSLDVADYLLGQYGNFLQFAGQKNGNKN